MPVLTQDMDRDALAMAVDTLQGDMERLHAQLGDLPNLYFEIEQRQDQVEALQDTVAAVAVLSAELEQMRTCLEEIIAKRGRGAVRLAEEALRR